MKIYIKYILTLLLMTILSITANSQSIIPLGTTAIGNNVKANNLSVSYRIGLIGNSTVALNHNLQSEISNDKTTENLKVTAYPNPFCDQLIVTFPHNNSESVNPIIQLIDVTGKIINIDNNYYDSNQGEITINASNIKRGNYIIRILIGKVSYTVKAIKI